MKKKLLCMVLSCAIIFGTFTPAALAAENAQRRWTECTECGQGRVTVFDTSYSAWYTYDRQPCQHGYPQYSDLFQRRQVTKTYQCNICGAGYVENTYENRTVCGHTV